MSNVKAKLPLAPQCIEHPDNLPCTVAHTCDSSSGKVKTASGRKLKGTLGYKVRAHFKQNKTKREGEGS